MRVPISSCNSVSKLIFHSFCKLSLYFNFVIFSLIGFKVTEYIFKNSSRGLVISFVLFLLRFPSFVHSSPFISSIVNVARFTVPSSFAPLFLQSFFSSYFHYFLHPFSLSIVPLSRVPLFFLTFSNSVLFISV